MKVWITKYALKDGIIEGETPDSLSRETPYLATVYHSGYRYERFVIDGENCFRNKESAIYRAEEMRQKKIENLKKQIKKLEGMRFDV